MVVWADIHSQSTAIGIEDELWWGTASKWLKLYKLYKHGASIHRDVERMRCREWKIIEGETCISWDSLKNRCANAELLKFNYEDCTCTKIHSI